MFVINRIFSTQTAITIIEEFGITLLTGFILPVAQFPHNQFVLTYPDLKLQSLHFHLNDI